MQTGYLGESWLASRAETLLAIQFQADLQVRCKDHGGVWLVGGGGESARFKWLLFFAALTFLNGLVLSPLYYPSIC